MQRPLLLTALLAGLLLAGASPASAATRQFDMWTSTEATLGRAHAYGVVDFQYSTSVMIRAASMTFATGTAPETATAPTSARRSSWTTAIPAC